MRDGVGADEDLEGIHILRAARGVLGDRAFSKPRLGAAQRALNGGNRVGRGAGAGIERDDAFVGEGEMLAEAVGEQLGDERDLAADDFLRV